VINKTCKNFSLFKFGKKIAAKCKKEMRRIGNPHALLKTLVDLLAGLFLGEYRIKVFAK